MNIFQLTRALVDIESTTGNEMNVGSYLYDYLSKFAEQTGGRAEKMHVEAGRFNVVATWGNPVVTLSTHMDTVPPFFASSEDSEFVAGRGSCDAKGIIVSMIGAAERLRADAVENFALLFVVGEERNSAGAIAAAKSPRGSRYLIDGEPTENKLAIASKGVLRLEIVAHGKMAHSAYPELGDSAIDALLDTLEKIRRIPLPHDDLLGACTLNIGTISGGRAPNVVADFARAEVLVRTVGESEGIRKAIVEALSTRTELKEVLCAPVIYFERVDGFEMTVVSYTTDVPALSPSWGKPLLIGPGSIHVAHTAEERVPKKQLSEAVVIYADLVHKLLTRA